MDWWGFLQYDDGNRDANTVVILPVVVVNQNSGNHEMRGEPYGVYQVNGGRLPTYGAISTASGIFITLKFDINDAYCNAFGPVASGIENFNMWDTGSVWWDGVQLE
jgi:hypothetical protein